MVHLDALMNSERAQICSELLIFLDDLSANMTMKILWT